MKPFKAEDLFPGRVIGAIHITYPANCIECGALVSLAYVHTQWHNKLADL